MSLPEILLWQTLRGGQTGGVRVRRQHPVGAYVLDFYVGAARLAIEVDGTAHDLPDRVCRDQARDAWLATQGIRVLRINAADILDPGRRDDVVQTIIAMTVAAP
jgi:very-short-patch-repair endonuclease